MFPYEDDQDVVPFRYSPVGIVPLLGFFCVSPSFIADSNPIMILGGSTPSRKSSMYVPLVSSGKHIPYTMGVTSFIKSK